ncbi:MAG: hypothetical protein IJX76_10385, partial [Clostridia bacterium]|nr:hypothetical protein [Clostridia bacterium]
KKGLGNPQKLLLSATNTCRAMMELLSYLRITSKPSQGVGWSLRREETSTFEMVLPAADHFSNEVRKVYL